MKKLLVIGAGGHGKVVVDTAQETGQWNEICFLDDDVNKKNALCKIIGAVNRLPDFLAEFSEVIVAIGDNKKRKQLLAWASELGYAIATIIHPRAFVSKFASVEKGVVIFAQAAINADSKIGFGGIINTSSTIEHDCVLGACVHISPNAVLAGGVKINEQSWIGAGSSVIEGVEIGVNVIIGAGSVVINDVVDNVIAVGNPARVIKQNEK